MEVTISQSLTDILDNVQLGVIEYEVDVVTDDDNVNCYFEKCLKSLDSLAVEEISHIQAIQYTREAYKKLGKSPSKYRNASEAMLRRIANKKGLYRVNNVVDVNNIMSITTGYSIGSYDMDKLQGNIYFDKAGACTYKGIGKELVNIENLPVLTDDIGFFGNPTSDSERSMVKEGRHQIMTVIYSFSKEDITVVVEKYVELLKELMVDRSLRIVNTKVVHKNK